MTDSKDFERGMLAAFRIADVMIAHMNSLQECQTIICGAVVALASLVENDVSSKDD